MIRGWEWLNISIIEGGLEKLKLSLSFFLSFLVSYSKIMFTIISIFQASIKGVGITVGGRGLENFSN